ncbi:hypothetical protein [Streptomyces lincolnensis]|uniref:hypothetical protein n=1 Tax=Streptomyces TaxID=1883 RepID=UPI001E464F83|nr:MULTISPECIES: hypothetical protein [Streptomyces]MCD7438856.1 hypothetical protein [Streptomyces lincolnensis]WLW52544.1 hypothetical protein QU709_14630 [Streptomyces coralus]
MYDLIPRALQRLRLLFAPSTGKRRRRTPFPYVHAVTLGHGPLTSPPLPRHRSPYGLPAPLDGTASALVRPYLAAHEEEAALKQRRRLALVLAADYGIDLDQHLIGAREVAA